MAAHDSTDGTTAGQGSTPTRPAGRRAITTVIDQGLSTITNAGVVIAVSSQESATNFGDFSLAYAMLAFALGIQRAAVADQLLVRSTEAGEVDAVDVARFFRSVGASALLASIVMTGAGLALGGVIGSYLVWLGLASAAVLTQDGLRLYAMARARPIVAAMMDGVWLAAFAGGLLLIPQIGGLEGVRIWGLSAVPSMIVGLIVLRPPNPTAVRRDAPSSGWIRLAFGLDFITVAAGGLLLIGGLRILIGPAAAAAIAAVLTVFRPSRSLISGMRLFYLPRLRSRMGSPSYRTELARWSAAVIAVLMGWLILAWLAESVIARLLGDTWSLAQRIMIAGAVFEAAASMALLWSDHLKVVDRGRHLVIGRVLFTGCYLCGALVGGIAASTHGAAIGMAGGAVLGLALWLIGYGPWRLRVGRLPRGDGSAPHTTVHPRRAQPAERPPRVTRWAWAPELAATRPHETLR